MVSNETPSHGITTHKALFQLQRYGVEHRKFPRRLWAPGTWESPLLRGNSIQKLHTGGSRSVPQKGGHSGARFAVVIYRMRKKDCIEGVAP